MFLDNYPNIKYMVESQFVATVFSTVLGLVVGSWLIQYRLNKKTDHVNTLRWLIEQVEEYANLAYDYWTAPAEDNGRILVLSARLKTEGFFLYQSVENVALIPKDRVAKVREEVSELWGAATGGVFDAGKRPPEDEVRKSVTAIARAAKTLKVSLYKCLTK